MASPDPDRTISQSVDKHGSLVARFRAPLLRYFQRRVRGPEDAEELTQEVFVRLLRRPSADPVESLEGFVFITAGNLLKDYYRARSRRRDTQSLDGLELGSPALNPAKEVEDSQAVGVLLGAIQALPPKCRAVFVMHRFDEVPHTEIARRLGITVSMVEKHIATALKHLRKHLTDEDHG
jgi:RNA polymerase sigma-70 factor (ECF subfamily)